MRHLTNLLFLTSYALGLAAQNFLVTADLPGRYGGEAVVAERSEPKTLNPVLAIDNASRDVIGLMMADLVHINRQSQQTEPALARSIERSADGRRYVAHLREGVQFADGHPFDADDVLFTFQVYLDEKIQAPQRNLMFIDGKPVSVSKKDAYTVVFEFSQSYGPGDRFF